MSETLQVGNVDRTGRVAPLGESRPRGVVAAAGAAALVVAGGLVAYGAYGDPSPKADQRSAVPFLVGICVVLAAVVFGMLVPKGLRALRDATSHATRWPLAFGIVAVVLMPAFWSGAPIIVGTGALILGIAARRDAAEQGRSTASATAAVVLGLIATVLPVVVTILGNTVAH
jgi:chromate transport protein ChrA